MDDPSRTFLLYPRATPTPLSASQQFLALVSDPFSSQMQSKAFFASLGTSLGITAIVALLFCFLRPYNATVYAPRLRHADEKHAPPALGKGPFAWLSPVLKTKEQALVDKIGMDAAVFIRFTKMCRNIFLVLTIVGCAILIPLNIKGANKHWNSSPQISNLIKMTPQFLLGKSVWGLVVCAWLINIIVCGFLWWNYRAVARLRRVYFESVEYQTSLHARTLMVTQIPKSLTTDEGLVRIVDSIKDNTVIPRAAIARNVKDLPGLIEEHEDSVRELEAVLAKYLKNPDKLPLNRPTCQISKNDPQFVKGRKVDAIEYLTRRIQQLEKKICEIRDSVDQRNAMSYGFASYESIEDAHSVAYAALKKKNKHNAVVRLAPRPSDILWNNLPLSPKRKRGRAITNNLWVALLTLVWIAPNALIAIFLSNLNNLGLIWPAFKTELVHNPKTWAIIQGVLAPAITSLVYFILPTIFRRLSMKAGDTTKTSRERHVTHKLYAFFVFNNLIVFSVFGAVWQFVSAVISVRAKDKSTSFMEAVKQGQLFLRIMLALCNVSPFWVTWLLQRNLGAAVDLSQIVNLAWGSIQRRFFSPTPRQLIELSAPPPFDYASYYNYFLFYATVALCFSTLQPLVLPITAFYFCLDAWLKKYLLMYVFVTKTESGGQFWRMLYNRFLVATFLSNVVVVLLVWAKKDLIGTQTNTMLWALLPLPVLLILFKWYCAKQFDDQIHFYTKGAISEESGKNDNMSMRSNQIGVKFGHPALFMPLMTPMVHAKSQHLLAKVYSGRLEDDDFDDVSSMGGYSDIYSMQNMNRGHGRKGSKAPKSSPFEFVSESDMDFENFKNRPEFRSEFGGDGEMYGKEEDQMTRRGTPANDRDVNLPGTTYPHGYTPTALRGYSPSPDRMANSTNSSTADFAGQGRHGLIRGAAPMGAEHARQHSLSRMSSAEEMSRGRQH